MLILNNKAVLGTGAMVYDIHRDTESQEPVGVLSYLVDENDTAVVIHLYDDKLIDGSNWPKGSHHYMSEIIDVLKIAEPNLKPITAIDINKRRR
jgi:hypothetical protein